MYEIIKLEGLYCIFKGDRIVCACETRKEAEETVAKYKAAKKKGNKR